MSDKYQLRTPIHLSSIFGENQRESGLVNTTKKYRPDVFYQTFTSMHYSGLENKVRHSYDVRALF